MLPCPELSSVLISRRLSEYIKATIGEKEQIKYSNWTGKTQSREFRF